MIWGVIIEYACILICRIKKIVDHAICLHEIKYVIIASGWWCGMVARWALDLLGFNFIESID